MNTLMLYRHLFGKTESICPVCKNVATTRGELCDQCAHSLTVMDDMTLLALRNVIVISRSHAVALSSKKILTAVKLDSEPVVVEALDLLDPHNPDPATRPTYAEAMWAAQRAIQAIWTA